MTSAHTQGKAILVLGWMGNTGYICAAQPGSARVSPFAPRPVTTSGHHHATQLSCSLKQQDYLPVYRKKPLAHVNVQSYQFSSGASWVTMLHAWRLLCLALWQSCSLCILTQHRYSEILIHHHLNISFFHTQHLESVCEKAILIYKGIIYQRMVTCRGLVSGLFLGTATVLWKLPSSSATGIFKMELVRRFWTGKEEKTRNIFQSLRRTIWVWTH